jgi:hypothetical protein
MKKGHMNIFPYRLSFFLTATGMLFGIAGLLLPAAFGSAPAQTPMPKATLMQPPPVATLAPDQQTQDGPTPVVEHRDPFVPDATSAPIEIQTNTPVTPEPQTGILPHEARFISASATPATGSAREPEHGDLTGIVIGDHPYALVTIDGKTRLLSVGDKFQGRKITTITMQGVALDDHSTAHIPLLDQ